MKELISHLLKQVAAILEYVIAFMLAIGIILLCLRMVCSLQYIPNLNTIRITMIFSRFVLI